MPNYRDLTIETNYKFCVVYCVVLPGLPCFLTFIIGSLYESFTCLGPGGQSNQNKVIWEYSCWFFVYQWLHCFLTFVICLASCHILGGQSNQKKSNIWKVAPMHPIVDTGMLFLPCMCVFVRLRKNKTWIMKRGDWRLLMED